jgi:DeoR/GlpR family transcriptional regulator of sugar metabolism
VLKMAEALALRMQSGSPSDIVVLTHSLALAEALARWCKVILVGGEVRVERRDVCGPLAEDTLRQFHVTRAFFGADAVNLRHGFMTTDERTSKMIEIVLGRAAHATVLADSEKFGRDSFIRYAGLEEVERIITDGGIPDDVLKSFTEAGARIEAVRR